MAPNSMSGSSPESGYSGIDIDGVRRGRRRRRTAWSTSAAYRVVDVGGVPRGRRLTKYGVVDADGVPLSRSGPRRGSSQAMVMTSAERAGGERLQRSAPGPGNSLRLDVHLAGSTGTVGGGALHRRGVEVGVDPGNSGVCRAH